MFERFTDRARRVLVLAQEEARRLDHGFLGTEHILLGLLHDGEGVAATALTSLGVSLDAAREKVTEIIGEHGGHHDSGNPPFTPRAKKVLELARREATQLGHEYIGTEHLLLDLMREGEGVACQVLIGLGADVGRVRQQVIKAMAGGQEPAFAGPNPGRVRERMRDLGPSDRCALCGRDLWQSAHVVVGARGWACEECIHAATRLLEGANATREVVLPPRVTGQPPDAEAIEAIVVVIQAAFGPDAGPSSWSKTMEESERLDPLLRRLRERWGRSETTRLIEVEFISPKLAYVRFSVMFKGSRGTDVSGQLRRHDQGWLVTAETLSALLSRQGIHE